LQNGLNACGSDVLTAPDDEVFVAAGNKKFAILVHVTLITRQKPVAV